MKKIFCFLFAVSGAVSLQAQIHEIGLFLGGSNYIGDIGPTTYIAPNAPAIGVIYKWNRSPRHSWRASATIAKIESHDSDSDASARQIRKYEFENTIKELSIGLEFDFFKFDLHDSAPQVTPYVYSGISVANYDGLFFAGSETRSNATHTSLAIPMILGLKARVLPNLVIAAEAGPRSMFKDDLDGSNPTNDNLESARFGNINSKDWYVFTGLTVTYTFGNKPCFCTD